MPEGNTCILEPNLEVLPLRYFSKGSVQFLFAKGYLTNDVLSDDKYSAVSRNLRHTTNN